MTFKTRKRKCLDLKYPSVSCFSEKNLKNIRKRYNSTQTKKNQIVSFKNKNKEFMHKELSKRLGEQEFDWILYGNNLENKFAPVVPDEWNLNKNAWLSNEDIDKVLKSFQHNFKKFYFFETAPIDFDKKYGNTCLVHNLCSFDFDSLIPKYDCYGVIFNTEASHEDGKHWISLFVSIKKKHIYFYDSQPIGNKQPPKEIMDLIKNKINKNKDYKIFINKKVHQKSNTECGMYGLYFILQMIKGESFHKFASKDIPDEFVTCLRGVFMDDINQTYQCSDKIQYVVDF